MVKKTSFVLLLFHSIYSGIKAAYKNIYNSTNLVTRPKLLSTYALSEDDLGAPRGHNGAPTRAPPAIHLSIP